MYACDWSKQANAELLLLHQTVVLVPAITDNATKQQIALHTNAEALQKLKMLAKTLIPESVKVSYSVSESHLQQTLPKLLAEPFENLIFVGLKGTGLLKKIFIGSVALQIIDHTKNTIVAMPKEIHAFSHEKLFVAVSEKSPLDILKMNNFLEFIDCQDTHITFFYLANKNEKRQAVEKQLRELSEKFADRFKTDFVIYEGFNSFADIKKVVNNKIDEVLIVQKDSHILVDKIFRRFLINELVYDGQTPLVILS